ncbi:MAG TPA: hypothetical protein ENJ55_03385 [Rhizobiales bacterium]|nr:hypothetical protein [Hyphomicrobiales bacterium]
MFRFFNIGRKLPEWQEKPYRIGKVASGRTVLVLGATSRAGRKLCRDLIDRGDRLIVLVRNRKKATHIFGPHAMVVTSLGDIGRGIPIDSVVDMTGSWLWGVPAKSLLLADLVVGRRAVKPRASGAVANWAAPFL